MNQKFARGLLQSPFSHSTLSLAGILLCVFTCLCALIITSRDQTGLTLAAVRSSYESSLSTYGRNGILNTELNSSAAEPTQQSEPAIGERQRKRRSLLDDKGNDASDATEPPLVDINGPMFTNLMRELSRYSKTSSPTLFDGQVAIDGYSPVVESNRTIVAKLTEILNVVRNNSQLGDVELELILWAKLPDSESLVAASLEADRLRSRWLGKNPSAELRDRIHSSGRVWTSGTDQRPVFTVAIRRSTTAP